MIIFLTITCKFLCNSNNALAWSEVVYIHVISFISSTFILNFFHFKGFFWLLVQNLNCVRHEILPIWSVSSLEEGTVFQRYKTVQLVPIINFKNGFPFLYRGIKGINSSLRGMGVGILSISNTYKCTCRRCTHYNTEK